MALQKRNVNAKVPDLEKPGKFKVVSYHSRNIVTLFSFLQRKFGDCLWMNVYDADTRLQIANFTKHRPPTLHV